MKKAFARVTGRKVNRGAGYGLEIPCVYQFYGPKPYIDKLREVIDSLREDIWTSLISVDRLDLQVVIYCLCWGYLDSCARYVMCGSG